MIVFNKNPEYFITIAKERSISKAAEDLYVSQPYLSQHLIRLEKSIGVKLFDRSQTPIVITSAGQIYYNYLESSYQLYQKLSSDLDNLNTERENTLNLGIGSWRGSTLLPDVLPAFKAKYPKTKIFLHEHPIDELYGLIEDNTIDIAIMNINWLTRDNLAREVIMKEKILLVANIGNPLTKLLHNRTNNGKTDLKVLENECFILLKPGLVCADTVNTFLDNNKIFIKNRIITTNNTTAINLVIENMGFCFMTETGLKRASNTECLEFFDLCSHDMEVYLAVIYKKNSYLSPTMRNFIDITKELYSSVKTA